MKRVVSGLYVDFFESRPRKTTPFIDALYEPYKNTSSVYILEDLFDDYVGLNIKEITGLNWVEFSNLPYVEVEMIRHKLMVKEDKK